MIRPLIGASVIFTTSLASMAVSAFEQNAKSEAAIAREEEANARVGEETTERVCSECHAVDDVTSTRRMPRDWNEMVAAMADRGATATQEELAIIRRYLARHFGLVAVNTASAEDLAAVLGLSAQDAERIVEYRKKNGKFVDAAALLTVPGIDRMKIEAQREALRFN
jgi:competence ComEA-like helix-hairpin-helix protein